MKAAVVLTVTAALASAGCASTSSSTPPRTLDEERAESAAVARLFLGDRPGGAWKAGAYTWVTVGRLYWVMGPYERPFPLLVAVVDGEPAPLRLSDDVAALKRFLSMQFGGRLPGLSALGDIAQLVKDGVVGKGGSIATPEFFESQRNDLGDWLKGRERDPAEFRRQFSGIRGGLDKNEWTLEFNIINGWGGVDTLRASGTASPLTLRQVSVDVVKPRGEFYYPLEG